MWSYVKLFVICVTLNFEKAIAFGNAEWSVSPALAHNIILQRDELESYTTAFINITYSIDKNYTKSIKSEDAKYGDFHVSSTHGILVHVLSDNSHHGCKLPFKASNGEIPNERWIALVKRGLCSFQTKMENAYYSNASGLIVYNDRDSQSLEKMKLQHNIPRTFSAIFTFKWRGEQLAELVDNGTKVMTYITVADICTRPVTNVNRTSVLFVSVSFIILMLVSLGWVVFYYIQKCRYIHAKDKLSKRLCCAAKKALQRIPTRSIKPDEKNSNGFGECIDCCAICIDLFKAGDIVRLLPCKHEFHKQCIDPWLLENRTCPMCKMDILKYFGFELTGSQESMLRTPIIEEGALNTDSSHPYHQTDASITVDLPANSPTTPPALNPAVFTICEINDTRSSEGRSEINQSSQNGLEECYSKDKIGK